MSEQNQSPDLQDSIRWWVMAFVVVVGCLCINSCCNEWNRQRRIEAEIYERGLDYTAESILRGHAR